MTRRRIRRPFVLALAAAGVLDAAYLLLAGAEHAVCRFANLTDQPERTTP